MLIQTFQDQFLEYSRLAAANIKIAYFRNSCVLKADIIHGHRTMTVDVTSVLLRNTRDYYHLEACIGPGATRWQAFS